MKDFLYEIEDLITTLGEDSIYVGNKIPSSAPYNTCSLERILGRNSEYSLDGIVYRNPSFSVYIRDENYDNAITRMQNIIELLEAINEGEIIKSCSLEGDGLIPLPLDEWGNTQLYSDFTLKIN